MIIIPQSLSCDSPDKIFTDAPVKSPKYLDRYMVSECHFTGLVSLCLNKKPSGGRRMEYVFDSCVFDYSVHILASEGTRLRFNNCAFAKSVTVRVSSSAIFHCCTFTEPAYVYAEPPYSKRAVFDSCSFKDGLSYALTTCGLESVLMSRVGKLYNSGIAFDGARHVSIDHAVLDEVSVSHSERVTYDKTLVRVADSAVNFISLSNAFADISLYRSVAETLVLLDTGLLSLRTPLSTVGKLVSDHSAFSPSGSFTKDDLEYAIKDVPVFAFPYERGIYNTPLTLFKKVRTYLGIGPLKIPVGHAIAVLKVTDTARRFYDTASGKARVEMATVERFIHKPFFLSAYSMYDNSFRYRKGKIVEPKYGLFDTNSVACAPGIHGFLSEKEAKEYNY